MTRTAGVPYALMRHADDWNSTIGAGDTLIAGMLYALICHADDWNTEAQLRFAVDIATEKVARDGFTGLGAKAIQLMQQHD